MSYTMYTYIHTVHARTQYLLISCERKETNLLISAGRITVNKIFSDRNVHYLLIVLDLIRRVEQSNLLFDSFVIV